MNNKELNIALGKLFNGIELDTHKVELGSLKEMRTQSDKLVGLYADLYEAQIDLMVNRKKLDDQINDAKRLENDAGRMLDKAYAVYNEFEQKAKDLGLDYKMNQEYRELDDSINAVLSEIDKLNKQIKG